ncbi:hypothetical protein VTI74DRAFT_904 [Chaetomium olivicolor]
MKLLIDSARGLLAAWLLAALTGTTTAHSWPKRTIRVAPNGTMVGKPGYERAHVGAGDEEFVWLIPPNGRPDGKVIHPDDKIARPFQRTLNYTSEFPMLNVARGDFVAIQYTENGHVSKADDTNELKPINRGTVYLYGTTNNDLTDMNLVDVHLKWTANGKGGNGKGRLLATRNYDDGQCHEAIPGSDREGITSYRMKHISKADALLCQTDLQIPDDIPEGQILTIIWVWDWPDMNVPGVAVPPASYQANSSDSGEFYVKMPEIYTGVVDFKIVDPCDDSLGAVKGPTCGNQKPKVAAQFVAQQDATTRGIRAQMENPFLVKVPQADPKVSSATADPSNIPMHGLIGLAIKESPSPFPLPSSILAAQDPVRAEPTATTPTATQTRAAPTGPSASKGQATQPAVTSAPTSTRGGEAGIVTVTVTVPQKISTVTVVRGQASSTAAPGTTSTKAPLRIRGAWYR